MPAPSQERKRYARAGRNPALAYLFLSWERPQAARPEIQRVFSPKKT